MSTKKPLRVWSCDRLQRYGIMAESWQQLLQKVDAKFGYEGKPFSIVLEDDGTEVDEAFWASLRPQQRLVVLGAVERWRPPPSAVPRVLCVDGDDTTDAANNSSHNPAQQTIHMFIELQNNPAALAMLNLDNLQLIKDFDVEGVLHKEDNSHGLDKQLCKKLQDLSIDLWVKRRTEMEAMDLIALIKSDGYRRAQ